jgi:hypothetical protein
VRWREEEALTGTREASLRKRMKLGSALSREERLLLKSPAMSHTLLELSWEATRADR